MNVGITGASGFIGGALLSRLLQQGNGLPVIERVVAFSTSEEGRRRLEQQFPLIEVKRLDQALTSQALNDLDVLVHAGWSTVPGTAQRDPVKDIQENLLGGIRLLDAAAVAGLKRFIFLSSGGTVYGAVDSPVRETRPVAPLHFYGASKYCFEQYLGVYARNSGFEHLSLRPSNVYGDLFAPTKPQGVIEHWLNAVKDDKPVQLWGTLDVVRDYVHINDLVDVLIASLYQPLPYDVLNIGTGKGTSLKELSDLISDLSGLGLRMDRLSDGPALVPHNVLVPDRVLECFGPRDWTPLSEGLRLTWDGILGRGSV